jgi:hypothetical protein
MKISSKKYIIAGSLIATVLAVSMKHGNDSSYSSQNHSKMIKDTSSPKESANTLKKITTKNNRGQIGVKTAPAAPILQKPTGYFSVDALLMNISYDWNDVYNHASANFSGSSVGQFSAKPYEFGWNWGVQASAGFRVSPDAWDLNFDFAYLNANKTTNFHGNSENSAAFPNLGVYGSIFGIMDLENPLVSLSQKNSFTYYDSDINLSREFFVSKRLSLMPYAGAKGVYIAQKFELNGDIINSSSTIQSNLKNNYWGVGPQIGSGIRFGFTKHFSLNFQLDGALLWGKVNSNQTLSSPGGLESIKVLGSRSQIVPNANILSDFIYDVNAFNDKVNFAIRLGYESRYYFSNLQANTIFNRSSGSTSIQGFNLGLRLTY